MKRYIISLLLVIQYAGFSQYNTQWRSYPSFLSITGISSSATNLLASTENTLLSINLSSGNSSALTTVDGLSGQAITALYHSNVYNITFIGYQNGLIIALNQNSNKLSRVTDIVNKNLKSNDKHINYFAEGDEFVYVSCGFGIVQLSAETLKFGDTYYIGEMGEEQNVQQTAMYNGYIFAATTTGIKKGLLADPNLIDYAHWKTVATSEFVCITAFADSLFAIDINGILYKYNSAADGFDRVLELGEKPNYLSAEADYMTVTCPSAVRVYDQNIDLVASVNNEQIKGSFTVANVVAGTIYIGTFWNGLYEAPVSETTNTRRINPDGPLFNNTFCLKKTNNALWLAYGSYDQSYNPYPLYERGISRFQDNMWGYISYENILQAKSIVKITANPLNQNEVYLSSYFSGLVRVVGDNATVVYNQTNSALESLVISPPDPTYVDIRINGSAFDSNGNLWITNSKTSNGLKMLLADGKWQSYNLESALSSLAQNDFNQLVIDLNGIKWFTTSKNGVVGFDDVTNTLKRVPIGTEDNTLPIENARTIAIDKSNSLWIGTAKGLRVLENTTDFQTKDILSVSTIIIEENDTAQELLYQQFITDIVVDGANNKWIATADSGVYLVSPNGQETFHHFTADNSPLPSNNINDIEINNSSGEVYIATSNGLVSFMGSVSEPEENLNSVYVFPNPVRPEYDGAVTISGLMTKANVKITDIEGNLVFEAYASNGSVAWDTTAFGKHKVASGVYVIFVTSKEGTDTKTSKVMIIR